MAKAVLEDTDQRLNCDALVGKYMLDVVTAGMYNEPLMILREYIQNAADSIDIAVDNGTSLLPNSYIKVAIDGQSRKLIVEDNGSGLSNSEAATILLSLGNSPKCAGKLRGFRGIGRLGGIGYCDEVKYETRSLSSEFVAEITWNCRALKNIISDHSMIYQLDRLIEDNVAIRLRRPKPAELPHFFKVTMDGVHRFHQDELMNLKRIRSYLSQVAPVDYDSSRFHFADNVRRHLSDVDGYRCYNISVNGERILRPYVSSFQISRNALDEIRDIDLVEFKNPDGHSIGSGWYAKTAYLASIPKDLNIRGIRVRQGNIEVGNEYFLENIYSERRFASWHIGEVHLNSMIRPNARRDGFEFTNDYEKFLEQANALGRHLSHLCRASSRKRSNNLLTERILATIRKALDTPFYFDEDHHNRTLKRVTLLLGQIRAKGLEPVDPLQLELKRIERRLSNSRTRPALLRDCLDGRTLRSLDKKSLITQICRAIAEMKGNGASSEDVLALAIMPYLKSSRKCGKKP